MRGDITSTKQEEDTIFLREEIQQIKEHFWKINN